MTFPDLPEALTQGDDMADAIASAREALSLALRGIAKLDRDIPVPLSTEGVPIAVDPKVAVKLTFIEAFRKSGISSSELARRLGESAGEVGDILDPDFPTSIGALQIALRVIDRADVFAYSTFR